ncbi:hypothetical protein RCC89_11755 [Cytophagaceae bacterium ABcell3]|nr:hypothetical protein RCC89_11755 [Cytophagaceae bacterium ABcell3]
MRFDKLFIWSVVLLCFSFQSFGQQPRHFSGKYNNLKSESGKAKFEWVPGEDEDDIVLHGDFEFIINKIDSSLPVGVIKKMYTGKYSNNFKHGSWRYEYADLLLKVKEVQDYTVSTSTEGVVGHLNAIYSNGFADGAWSVHEDLMKAGEIQKVLKTGSANFREGFITGNIDVSAKGEKAYEVKGGFDEYGFLDGFWTVTYLDNDSIQVVEHRQYESGFLLFLLKQNKTTGDTLTHVLYEDVKLQLDNIDNQDDYSISDERFGLMFDNGYQPDSKKSHAQIDGNDIIVKAMQSFSGRDSLTFEVKGGKEIKTGATKRFYYPLSEEDEFLLQKIRQEGDSIKELLTQRLNDPVFKIYHQQSDSLAYIFNYYSLAVSKAEKVSLLSAQIMEDDFRFKNINNYFSEGISGLSTKDSVVYEFDGQEERRLFEPQLTFSVDSSPLSIIDGYFSELIAKIESYERVLLPALDDVERQRYSTELENIISENIDEIEEMYVGKDTMPVKPNYLQRKIYDRFAVSELNRMKQEYAQLTELDKKKSKAKTIIELQTTLKNIHRPLGNLPERREKLDSVYTVWAYNPYMDRHDIKVRVKPRLYNALVHDVWPCLEDALLTEDDFTNLEERVDMIDRLYYKAIELRKRDDKEASKLERKIRRERDIMKIIQMLDI